MKKKINILMGLNARDLRIQSGYTQENIADLLGMSRYNWVNIEAGRQTIMPDALHLYCRIIHCHPNDIYPPVQYLKKQPAVQMVKRKVVVVRTYKKRLKLKKVKSNL